MWPLVKKRSGNEYMLWEKLAWSLWHVVCLLWIVLVSLRVLHFQKGPQNARLETITKGRTIPIWEIPFPAVTICNQITIDEDVYPYMSRFRDATSGPGIQPHQVDELVMTSLLCDPFMTVKDQANRSRQHIDPKDVHDFADKVKPAFAGMFAACSWRNEITDCSKLFKKSITDEGVCYTFNGIDLWNENSHFENADNTSTTDWSMGSGYTEDAQHDAYPRRSNAEGLRGALNVVLVSEPAKHHSNCKGPIRGFKVQLHNPADPPHFKSGYLVVPPDQEVTLAVIPESVRSADSLRTLHPQMRECMFEDEMSLKTFKRYSHRKCYLECLAEHTLKTCNCLAYYMPMNKSTPVCGGPMKTCYLNASDSVVKRRMEMAAKSGFEWFCNCLLDCSADSYRTEYSTSKFSWMSVLQSFKANKTHHLRKTMSRLSVYIKDQREVDQHTFDFVQPPFSAWMSIFVIMVGLSFVMMSLILYLISSSSSPYSKPAIVRSSPQRGRLIEEAESEEPFTDFNVTNTPWSSDRQPLAAEMP